MTVLELFRESGDHLVWTRVADDHVVDAPTGIAIEPDEAYFVVRLSEMFLGRSRTLWRRFYPLVHAFITHDGGEEHAVAGPNQLQSIADANLDRVVSLNVRLAGPIPFRGGDVSVVAGLYSVPGDDAARALVETVGAIAGLATLPANPLQQVTNVVKAGIDGILRLGATKLQLGVNDTITGTSSLRSGYYLGIGAPRRTVDLDKLWLRDGRLVTGADPIVGEPYRTHDYMVVQIERRERRPDWPALPQMAEHQSRFNSVLSDDLLAATDKRDRIGQLWPAFYEALQQSPHLTRHDAMRIANDVEHDLKGRLAAQETGNPFETKTWEDGTVVAESPHGIDFAAIQEYDLPPHSARSGIDSEFR